MAFNNQQLLLGGLVLAMVGFLSIGVFPFSIAGESYFKEVGTVQYTEGSGDTTLNILDYVSSYNVPLADWTQTKGTFTIKGFQEITSNGVTTKSLVISHASCPQSSIVLNPNKEFAKLCVLGTGLNGEQETIGAKILSTGTTADGKQKWTIGIMYPNTGLLKYECQLGDKVVVVCSDGSQVTTKECVSYSWKSTGDVCPTLVEDNVDADPTTDGGDSTTDLNGEEGTATPIEQAQEGLLEVASKNLISYFLVLTGIMLAFVGGMGMMIKR